MQVHQLFARALGLVLTIAAPAVMAGSPATPDAGSGATHHPARSASARRAPAHGPEVAHKDARRPRARASVAAAATRRPRSIRTAAPARASVPATDAGLVIARDPATGAIAAPTSEQWSRLAAARSLPPRPIPIYGIDGSVRMNVRTWMREYAVVRVAADGTARLDCVDGAADAARTVTAPAAPALEVE